MNNRIWSDEEIRILQVGCTDIDNLMQLLPDRTTRAIKTK